MKTIYLLSLLLFLVGCNPTKQECTEFIPDDNFRYAKYCEMQAMMDIQWEDTWDKSKSPSRKKRLIFNDNGNYEIVDSWRLPSQ